MARIQSTGKYDELAAKGLKQFGNQQLPICVDCFGGNLSWTIRPSEVL